MTSRTILDTVPTGDSVGGPLIEARNLTSATATSRCSKASTSRPHRPGQGAPRALRERESPRSCAC